jgi:hypothetical protein
MKLSFVLIGEGSSDLRMVSHIENILITEGFSEVSGKPLEQDRIGRTVFDKLLAARKLFPSAGLIIIHRDADNAGSEARLREINEAVNRMPEKFNTKVIPMIPVKMTEAWLLADRKIINRVAGNVDCDDEIRCIPPVKILENRANVKELLLDALCEASGLEGGRLKPFKKRFGEMRARIMEDLAVDGPQKELPSYQAFRRELKYFSSDLLSTE